MFSLLSITGAGGILGTGLVLGKKRKPTRLIHALVDKRFTDGNGPKQSRVQQLKQKLVTQLEVVDEHYQRFVQVYIDPLLGKTRHSQLQDMLRDESFALTRDERMANRRFGTGLLALSLALLGQWVFAPL